MATGSGHSFCNAYELWSDNEEYLTSNNQGEWACRCSDHKVRLLPTAKLYLDSPPDATKNWGQFNPNINDYPSDPTAISSTFWIPDITNWWHQQEEMNTKYIDLSNVTGDIFSIIPHGVGVEASISLG
jgi:hypothetical protein